MLDEMLKKYRKKFGEGFPMIPLKWGRTDSEVIEIIENCLTQGKDVYELGLVSDDEDVIY